MSSIVRQRVGDTIYLYESVSFRNAEGKPRNRRTPIGKLDPSSGLPIYKPEYLARKTVAGDPVDAPAIPSQTFTVRDIQRSRVLEYGTMYLLQSIAGQIGLTEALKRTFPQTHREVFTLASYLVCSGSPFLYCEDWLSKNACADVGCLSSQRISDLLQSIRFDEREAFFQAWCKLRSEQEYLALDITSTSSYSKLIQDVEWGYNRDKEQLPQINICMLMGQTSRLPIYQVLYSGSLKDVSTLETTLSKMDTISAGKPTLAVMDKGFFSAQNIDAMLDRAHPIRFVIPVPFTSRFAKQIIESERKKIDSLQHTLVLGEDTLRAISKERVWNERHSLHTHVYYHAMKALKTREELYAHATVLKERAEADPTAALADQASLKYLMIRKSKAMPSGYTVKIREKVITKELETAGWMVLISNDISNAKEALSIYRHKDVVEKGLLRLKTQLDLGRLRVHHDDSMQNKLFIGFIALILMSHLHQVMLEKGLYKRMTMKKLLLNLSKLRVQRINAQRILFPLTKEQKDIYKAFRIKNPM